MTNQSSLFETKCVRRGAFTLVELLVVIVIIGILIAILIPAVMGVIGRSQESSVAVEIASLSAGLERFKNDNSVSYPPDFSENIADNQLNSSQKRAAVDRMLGRLYRNRNASQDIPYNVNAVNASQPTLVDFGDLDAAEGIVFWLLGFTDNAQYPLTGGANNGQFPVLYMDPKSNFAGQPDIIIPAKSSVMELDLTRLGDRDKDGFPEYYPKFGGGAPYIFFNNQSYQRLYAAAISGDARVPAFWVNRSNSGQGGDQMSARPAPMPYLAGLPDNFVTSNNSPEQKLTAIATNQTLKNYFAEANKYQIIAPGLDGQYLMNADTDFEVFKNPKVHPQLGNNFLGFAYVNGPYTSDKAQKDNITNFAGGTLESKVP